MEKEKYSVHRRWISNVNKFDAFTYTKKFVIKSEKHLHVVERERSMGCRIKRRIISVLLWITKFSQVLKLNIKMRNLYFYFIGFSDVFNISLYLYFRNFVILHNFHVIF